MGAHTISYEDLLIKQLAADPAEVEAYLREALLDDDPRVHALAREHVRKAEELRARRQQAD